jgi:hypothetical protein
VNGEQRYWTQFMLDDTDDDVLDVEYPDGDVDLSDGVGDVSVGPCCICRIDDPTVVHNILMLNAQAPVRGRGWGCLECKIPMNGAIAVVCQTCWNTIVGGRDPYTLAPGAVERELVDACRGYPAEDGRISYAELLTFYPSFDHRREFHQELRP